MAIKIKKRIKIGVSDDDEAPVKGRIVTPVEEPDSTPESGAEPPKVDPPKPAVTVTEVPNEVPKVIPPVQVAVQARQQSEQDMVTVQMLETVDPSPRIGDWNFVRDASVTSLQARQNYTMPRYAAEVLIDKKKGVLLP